VFHADIGGIFDFLIRSAQGSDRSTRRYGTGDTRFTLASYFRSRNRSIFLVENADRARREEEF
jgi:hypothetical protein